MKRLTALILTVLMVCSALPFTAFGGRFKDVPDGKWYSEGISFCAANGYMDGVSGNEFDRQSDLTRAMFMTILAKVDGADLTKYRYMTYFGDVKTDQWYTGAITWAYINGLASGTAEYTFGYKDPVTREQIALVLYAYSDHVNNSRLEDAAQALPAPANEAVSTEEAYNAALEAIAELPDHRDIGELQSETQEMILLEGEYYQSYVASTHDMRYIFISSAEYEMSPDWNWMPVGTRDDYSLDNLGKIDEDMRGGEPEVTLIDLSPRADLSVFTDGDRTHDWARDAMKWAVAVGLISGTGETTLDPRGNCSRAQAAVIIRSYVLGMISECEHDWVEPTCVDMGYCTKCELKQATELGHEFEEHYCTESVKCIRCDVMCEVRSHYMLPETCTTPEYCTLCGYEGAPATGHLFYKGTPNCIFPRRCMICSLITDEALGHDYKVKATCTTDGYCDTCGFIKPAFGHTTDNGFCERCGQGNFEDIFHYLSYYADYNIVIDFPTGGYYYPNSVRFIKEGESRGWFMKDKQYDNVVYFCYGSVKDGRRTEIGIQIAPTKDAVENGEYLVYGISYGKEPIYSFKKTVKASDMHVNMPNLELATPYLGMKVSLWQTREELEAYYDRYFEDLFTDHLIKALSYAKYRLAEKGMLVNIDDLGFINF